MNAAPLTLKVEVEKWPLSEPFHITGHVFEVVDVVVATLGRGGHAGKGEASGVYYLKDDAAHMVARIESARAAIEAGVTRESLQKLLPAGGARNALDCALWDLEAKESGRSAWDLAGLAPPTPLLTTYTLGANTAEKMAAGARGFEEARALKLKLTGEALDADRVRAVREARPDVWLAVDANQGFTRASLERLLPVLVDAKVQLIEQPFKVGEEAQLDGMQIPIPLAADETVQTRADIPALAGRFNVVNVKLDKCGGLSEALVMHEVAREHGLDLMVGNMVGTALAMAPSSVVGQLCKVVDLDGPLFLAKDRVPGTLYRDGKVSFPKAVWGFPG